MILYLQSVIMLLRVNNYKKGVEIKNMAAIGQRIKQRRIELGMTQEELAHKMGYASKTTINKIENGINDVTQSKIIAFSKALETSVAYLMGWDDNLNKDAAILTVDLLSDQDAMNAMKKILELSKEDKKTIYDMIDFLYQKEES